MNKYLGLGLVLLASTACNNDTLEQPQQPATPSERMITFSLEAKQPEFVDLDDESRVMSNVKVNSNGYPVIELPEKLTSFEAMPGLDVRWRYVSKSAPDDFPTEANRIPNGLSVSDGETASNTGYAAEMGSDYSKRYARVIMEGGKQKLRVFLPYSAMSTPWWGDANYDLYVFIATGLKLAGGFEAAGGRFITGGGRVKMYYTGASGGTDYRNMFNVGDVGPTTEVSLQRRAVVASATTSYQQLFPYMTTYRKAKLYAKSGTNDPAQVNASATYALAGVDNGVLEPRGTILSINFANVTSSPIVVTDIELKNDAFAYDGYFSGAGATVDYLTYAGTSQGDGIPADAVLSGSEVKALSPLKFIETNLAGYSQYTINRLRAENPSINYPGIPTSASFGVYADGTTTDKGITIESGEKSRRVFIWGYPKGNGTTPLKVKISYTSGGNRYVAYQRINPPTGGFSEGKAYLKTLVVGRNSLVHQ